MPWALRPLAGVCIAEGRLDLARATLAEAFDVLEATGQRVLEAELHELTGELVLADSGDRAEARRHFVRALTIARNQDASVLERRAAASLDRLRCPGGAAETLTGPRVPCVQSTMHLYPIDGACHRVAGDATAFAYREANLACVIAGMWPDSSDNERNMGWVRDYWEAIHPALRGGRLRQLHGRRRPGPTTARTTSGSLRRSSATTQRTSFT